MRTPLEIFADREQFACIFDSLVDLRYGVIRRVFQKHREADRPNIFIFVAEACNTGVFVTPSNFRVTAGASQDPRRAITKAVGEAIERYCGAIYWTHDLPLTSYEDATFACVVPSEFARYSPLQLEARAFPFAPFKEDTLIRWVEAKAATTDDRIHLPASMVYVPYTIELNSKEKLVNQPISTGLAAHNTFSDAALNGLMEIVERDAFTTMWQSASSAPHISRQLLGPELLELISALELSDRLVTLLDLTTDTCIPTILAVQTSDNPRVPCLVVAGAASNDANVAILKSLEELALTADYMQTLHEQYPPFVAEGDFANVINQQSHLRFWCNHDHSHYAEFLLSSRRTSERLFSCSYDRGTTALNFSQASEFIERLGYRVWTVDVTTDDIRNVGLKVVRTVVPGFHPLAIGHRARLLDGLRLNTVPFKYYDHHNAGSNPVPHPYP